jgi:hypothetical protein
VFIRAEKVIMRNNCSCCAEDAAILPPTLNVFFVGYPVTSADRLHTAEWYGDWYMINVRYLKGSGRGLVEKQSQHMPVGTEKNDTKHLPGYNYCVSGHHQSICFYLKRILGRTE